MRWPIPSRTMPAHEPTNLQTHTWQSVTLQTGDGLALGAWYLPPSVENGGATLPFVHGLGSNRGELLDQATLLTPHGFGALLLNLRNPGTNQGNITTLGYNKVQDVEATLRFLTQQAQVDAGRIALIGHSRGAAVAIRAAARQAGVAAVVAENGFTNLEDHIVRGRSEIPPVPLVG